MKKLILNRTIATITFLLVVSFGAFAQVMTGIWKAPVGNDVNDTVTINSIMPYRVTGDLNMHALRALGVLNYSWFTKTISAGGTIHDATGAGAPANADSSFSVAWNALGAQTVAVTEVPQQVSALPFPCAANTQTLNVVVLNRPTAVWNGAPSATGCNVAGTTVTVPYTLAGTGQYNLTYRITFTSLAGAASNVVAAGTVVNGLGSYQTGSANLTISYAVPAAAYGKYDVYIENVTDRISRKSGILTSLAADIPAAASTFFAYPTPQTNPIQHLQNL
jgi:hypothetical protein